MKRNFVVEGSYWSTSGTERPFTHTFEYEISEQEEKANSEFLGMLVKPWKLLGLGKKFGFGGLIRFLWIGALFILVNLFFLLDAFLEYFFDASVQANLNWVLLVALASFVFTGVAIYKAYRYMVVDFFQVIYDNNPGFVKGLSRFIVSRSEEIIKDDGQITRDDLSAALDLPGTIQSRFHQAPRIMRKVMSFFVRHLPLADILETLNSELKNTDREQVVDNLNVRLDAKVRELVFDSNTTTWVFWLLPLNLFIQIALMGLF